MKIALLMTDENIVGREILRELGGHGIAVQAVIVEQSARAEEEKLYLKNDFYSPPSFGELLAVYPAETHRVGSLNGEIAEGILRGLSPDLILLDGSTIIKKRIFSLAKIGALNSHPGLLPEYRGVDSVRWAIYHRKPVGATCHFVDEGLDTGPILLREEVQWRKGETVLAVRVRVMRICVDLVRRSVEGLRDGTLTPLPQPKEGGYYSWAPPEVQEGVDAILKGE